MTRNSVLKAVLFDLVGTLIHYEGHGVDFGALGQEGLRGFYAALRRFGIAPAAEAFAAAYRDRFAHAYRATQETLRGDSTDRVLQEGLASLGLSLTDGVWAACRAAFYAPIHAVIRPVDGAVETLRALQARCLRLGLVSNTFWPADVHDADMAACGLLDLVPRRVYSSAAGYVKPHPQIYRRALAEIGVQPEDVVFVGDRLKEDVAGPQGVGLRAVLVEVPFREEHDASIVPDARIASLKELPAALAAWASLRTSKQK
ncbi:MAG: HAD family hydrolase [Anaerolineae bacterium]|nr:HAD family hydrolase [Anaerolineae bacterium]